MPAFLGAAARASLVQVTCPACGEVQARARSKKGAPLTCRKCKQPIRAETAAETATGKKQE